MSNKKKLLILVLVLFAAGVGAAVVVIASNKSLDIQSFDVSEYRDTIEQWASEENVGPVADAKELLEKAEELWVRIYGEQIKSQKPYQVFYDETNGVWLVRGTLRSNMDGGVAYILVENDTGSVLAVWHDK